MKYTFEISDSLRELIRHLPPQIKKRVKKALKDIAEQPEIGKPLTAKLEGLFSYKLGRIRIIYQPVPSTIRLITIGPRKTVYEKAALEIKRSSSHT